MVLDIILAAVLAIAFLTGIRQGFVKSVWKLAAWIVTGIVVYIALAPVVEFVSATPLYDKIYENAARSRIEYFMWDGTHPSIAGHMLIAEEWFNALDKS